LELPLTGVLGYGAVTGHDKVHLLYFTNLFKGVLHNNVLHVPCMQQSESCPNNSHWPVTHPAFWQSLDTVNTYSLSLYLWYCNKNFNRKLGLFGPAGGIIGAAVSPKYRT